jgi:hypothetical protein
MQSVNSSVRNATVKFFSWEKIFNGQESDSGDSLQEILRLFDVSETRLVDLTKSCGFVRKKFLSQQTPFRDRLNGKATNLVSALRLL